MIYNELTLEQKREISGFQYAIAFERPIVEKKMKNKKHSVSVEPLTSDQLVNEA